MLQTSVVSDTEHNTALQPRITPCFTTNLLNFDKSLVNKAVIVHKLLAGEVSHHSRHRWTNIQWEASQKQHHNQDFGRVKMKYEQLFF